MKLKTGGEKFSQLKTQYQRRKNKMDKKSPGVLPNVLVSFNWNFKGNEKENGAKEMCEHTVAKNF